MKTIITSILLAASICLPSVAKEFSDEYLLYVLSICDPIEDKAESDQCFAENLTQTKYKEWLKWN